jgi:hypothetical protein
MKINESKSRIELFFMVVWFHTKRGFAERLSGEGAKETKGNPFVLRN